jgi:hypothetical protein
MNLISHDSSPVNESEDAWWTSGWFKVALVLLGLIVAFYTASNWLGAAAWKKAQVEITAAGESLDPNKFIPPPVPDEQNFAALPFFQLETGAGYSGYPEPLILERAFIHVDSSKMPYDKSDQEDKNKLPYLGNWKKGEPPDLPAIEQRLTDLCSDLSSSPPLLPNASLTDLFGRLCPVLAELRAANGTRPLCRFNEDYNSQPPWNRPLTGVVSQISVAKVLSYEERLALFEHRPDLAIDDLKVGWKIDSGLRQEPLIISGLVALGVVAIQLGVVSEGLADHAWDNQQLVELDDELGKIDFLAESQFCLRGDVAVQSLPDIDYLNKNRLEVRPLLTGNAVSYSSSRSPQEQFFDLALSLVVEALPSGWFELYKADFVRFHLLGTVRMVDPASRRVFPEKEKEAMRLLNDSSATGLWHDFETEWITPTLNSVKRFAQGQANVDQARIACRLERYRLTHGAYPATLTDLIPAYGPLPHDIMTGDPYRYRVATDGTYLLYSVGWNQKDDGGDETPDSDGNKPDWVWASHPDAAKPK